MIQDKYKNIIKQHIVNEIDNFMEAENNGEVPAETVSTYPPKKFSLKRALSIRNIINTLHLTPFDVLKLFWNNISIYSHKYRNLNQVARQPDTLEKMRMLEDIGLFKLLGKNGPTKGHTGAHNIPPAEKGLFGRWDNFLTLDGHGENLDYRGVVGTCFEGIQCIYNENTGKLVTEDLNKGTFDYTHPSKDNFKHFINDVLPWIVWSNCGDDPPRTQLISNSTWKLIENTWNSFSREEIDKNEAKFEIGSIIEKLHPIKKRVILSYDKNDKPDFEKLEIDENRTAESLYLSSGISYYGATIEKDRVKLSSENGLGIAIPLDRYVLSSTLRR